MKSTLIKGFNKVLICGGWSGGDITTSCETITLNSTGTTTCKTKPNFPVAFYGAIGGMGIKQNPIVCGGWQNNNYSNRCYSSWGASKNLS